MEEKTFELLTKLYSKFAELYSEFAEFKKDTSAKLTSLDSRLAKVEICLESDVKDGFKALFDGYQQTYELCKDNNRKLDALEYKADYISLRLNKQETDIRILQGCR